ncbi:MAG: cellulose biosynthesis protein BcsS [Hyphomicrobiaceae bacterium]|nr:cellulose biosynthesis protein BcsS [Hyphomicrobiaceae bacterium]
MLAIVHASLSTGAAADQPRSPRHTEVWAGADAGEDVWLIYSGGTIAPFGDIHDGGLRLRVAGGFGQYRYQSHNPARGYALESFAATASFADALVGYLWRLDPLILKLFIGAGLIEHDISPVDGHNLAQGPDFGAKAVAEVWVNIGPSAYASVDIAWAQAHETMSGRGRLGYRMSAPLSLGIEAAANVDQQAAYKMSAEQVAYRTEAFDYGKVGAFVRYEWAGGEVSASAGLLGDVREQTSPYATLNWLMQF